MKPRVLVARQIFPEVVERLRAHFEVEAHDEPVDWPRDDSGSVAMFTHPLNLRQLLAEAEPLG